jgi:hypothetical protein
MTKLVQVNGQANSPRHSSAAAERHTGALAQQLSDSLPPRADFKLSDVLADSVQCCLSVLGVDTFS